MKKPDYLKPNFDTIPETLKTLPRIVLWRAEKRDGKWTKPPFQTNGQKAKSDDAATWTTFESAQGAYNNGGKFDGIGFVLNGDGIVAIDMDHVVENGKIINEDAKRIVSRVGSYAEISPSGTGIRILCRGKLPPSGRKKGQFEFYETGRYVTLTGRHIEGTPNDIKDCNVGLQEAHSIIFGNGKKERQTKKTPPQITGGGWQERLEKAFNSKVGDDIKRLWDCDPSGDRSADDLSLCSYLAFWFSGDAYAVDAAFRSSPRMRDKWDEKHYSDGRTYGEVTIRKAIEGATAFYGENTRGPEGGEKTDLSVETMKALSRNEDGDGELLQLLCKNKLVYDHAAGRWYVWKGHSWVEDTTGEAIAAVKKVVARYEREVERLAGQRTKAARERDAEKEKEAEILTKRLLRRIGELQRLQRKQNVLVLARSGEGTLGISGNEWDTDPMLLGVKNGVINLKDGTFRVGEPSDYIKTASPTEWNGMNEPSPLWNKYLEDTFDNNTVLIDFVQRLLGYGITGLSIHHVFPILFGSGRNGKGTLLETLRFVLGDYALKTESELILEQKYARNAGSPNSAVLSLRGRRLVWASETSDGRRMNAGKLKELVGGDTLNARGIRAKHHVQFRPSHLLLLLTNNKPSAPASDYAFWKRVHLIPFNTAFVDNPKRPNERKADPYLGEKLKAEAAGILAWLVRGCMEWKRSGLNPPDLVSEATEGYRQDEDTIGLFVGDRMVKGKDIHIGAGEAYKAYRLWCEENGLHAMSGTRFGKEMKARFDFYEERNRVFYVGIGLLA